MRFFFESKSLTPVADRDQVVEICYIFWNQQGLQLLKLKPIHSWKTLVVSFSLFVGTTRSMVQLLARQEDHEDCIMKRQSRFLLSKQQQNKESRDIYHRGKKKEDSLALLR